MGLQPTNLGNGVVLVHARDEPVLHQLNSHLERAHRVPGAAEFKGHQGQ